ncbi:MAG: hypothetical protein LAP38_21420 [Acidobacteriia bacterium]|nr:hypothetical protein [Terriglobia bacterium]
MLNLVPERSAHKPIVTQALILAMLFQGISFAQTYQSCTISNGLATGVFGGVLISGTFTSGASPETSSIAANRDPNSVYMYSYTFTGPLNGLGYTQTSKMPAPPCILGPPCPGPGTASLHVSIANATMVSLGFEDSAELFTGFGSLSCVTQSGPPPPPPPPTCGPFNVVLSGDGTPTITAKYTPANGKDLQTEASDCGYMGFDWRQQVKNLPCPSPNTLKPNDPSVLPAANYCGDPTAGSLTAGGAASAPPFDDPPLTGYSGSGYNPFPFYYSVADATTIDNPATLNPTNIVVNNGGKTLEFADTPRDFCLPTGGLVRPSDLRNQYCGGYFSTAPVNSSVGFETSLVGIVDSQTASAPLYRWTWIDTYNGLAGGTHNGLPDNTYPGLSSAGPAIPGTGYGGITITSINGVPVPPIVPPDQIAITASGLAYSRVSQTFNGTVTIKNTSGASITTPTNFQVVLTALPSGVTLANSAGTFNQSPYVTVPTVTSLAPGQSVSVQVRFQNPSGVTISFTPEFYAGSFQ